MICRFVSIDEILPLRHAVLRPHVDKSEDCVNPDDHKNGTFHVAMVEGSDILSIASFVIESLSDVSEKNVYRLRGMATLPEHQKKGFGRKLVQFGEQALVFRKCEFLWLKARVNAIGFYQSLGFQERGEFFDIPPLGPHKVMYKYLNPR